MTKLMDTIDNQGPPIFYGKRFRRMIEDHLMVIKGMSTTQTRPITEDDWAALNRYEGDFYGFLDALGYEKKYHWTIMRLNGFRSRFDLDLNLTHLLLPDWDFVSKLAQLSKEKIK